MIKLFILEFKESGRFINDVIRESRKPVKRNPPLVETGILKFISRTPTTAEFRLIRGSAIKWAE